MATNKKTEKKRLTLQEQADEILRIAEEYGVEQNFFFTTTFNRYKVQLNTMERLEKEIKENELFVEREYIKGKKNLVMSPAVSEYNKVSTAANQTVRTLIDIIKAFAAGPIMSPAGHEDDCDL